MQISEVIVLGLIGAVGTYVLTMVARDRLRKRRTVRSLATRVQHDDEGFARFWHPDPKQADIAIRARRVLARNLEMPLKGLKPSDRLKEDLNAELEINPHLFWELEEEFAIKTDIDDLETFEETLQRLVTFEDLVKFLEERISTTHRTNPLKRTTRSFRGLINGQHEPFPCCALQAWERSWSELSSRRKQCWVWAE
jgi:acyl carrier protein